MSGTRQSGILSGLCFNTYISPLINKLGDSGYGRRFLDAFLGYIMYTDDILLLSASFSKLQEMLIICHAFGVEWHISFNPKKSHLCALGRKPFQKLFCV